MKKKFYLLILSFLLLSISFSVISEASEKIELIESVFVKQINSEKSFKKLQDIEGLTYQAGSRRTGEY